MYKQLSCDLGGLEPFRVGYQGMGGGLLPPQVQEVEGVGPPKSLFFKESRHPACFC